MLIHVIDVNGDTHFHEVNEWDIISNVNCVAMGFDRFAVCGKRVIDISATFAEMGIFDGAILCILPRLRGGTSAFELFVTLCVAPVLIGGIFMAAWFLSTRIFGSNAALWLLGSTVVIGFAYIMNMPNTRIADKLLLMAAIVALSAPFVLGYYVSWIAGVALAAAFGAAFMLGFMA
eukprot:TRINITY_DN16021_c0_g1_i1.p1 TRINITY_DN16021_c0_g1~~TRINITY_DN16021_c0_g1_i1.p1  ORF type:complete len:176 (-),score=31.26 TRINITY_DN16021_c0_g1_i1:93-620(-)